MTKPEAMKIVCVLFGSFPNARFTEQNFESYAEGLLDLDGRTCGAAVQRLIRTNRFLPSIAEIREASTAQRHGPRKTGAEAYEELLGAVQRHGHYPEVRWVDGIVRVQSPWPPVPSDVARAMRQTWGSWDACCTETGPDAPDRARFIAAYDGIAERERADLVSGQPLPAPASSALKLITQQQQIAMGSAARLPTAITKAGEEPRPAGAPFAVTAPEAPIAPPREPRAPARAPRRWTAEELDAELARAAGGRP